MTYLDRIDFMKQKAVDAERTCHRILDRVGPSERMDLQSVLAEIAAIKRCADETPQ